MKMTMMAILALAALALGACSTVKHMAGADQCTAPTAREAQITKRVWR